MDKEIETLLALSFGDLQNKVALSYAVSVEVRPTADIFKDAQKYALIANNKISKAIKNHEGKIKREICEKHKYCKVIKSDKLKMIKTIIDSGIIIVLGLPIPAVTLSVYILRLGYFDQLCGCEVKESTPA